MPRRSLTDTCSTTRRVSAWNVAVRCDRAGDCACVDTQAASASAPSRAITELKVGRGEPHLNWCVDLKSDLLASPDHVRIQRPAQADDAECDAEWPPNLTQPAADHAEAD